MPIRNLAPILSLAEVAAEAVAIKGLDFHSSCRWLSHSVCVAVCLSDHVAVLLVCWDNQFLFLGLFLCEVG